MEDVMRLVLALTFGLAVLLIIIMFLMGVNINVKGGWVTALIDAIRFLLKPIV